MFDSFSTKYFRFARFAFFMEPEQSKDVFMAAVKERDITEARDLNTVERLTTAQDVLPLTPQCTPREIDVLSQRFDRVVEVLWWPVSLQEARSCGAHAPATSVLLRVRIDESMLAELNDIIPDGVRTRPGDTAAILANRLESCKWFDEIHVKRGGCGPLLKLLVSSVYAQPRRVTWSVLVSGPEADADGDLVQILYLYGQFGHCPKDVRSRPMPRAVENLMLLLWQVAHPLLGTCSKAQPPLICQLLVYHALFNGCIGRHRDFFTSADAVDALVEGIDVFSEGSSRPIPTEGLSQIPMSDVLVWTTGTATMALQLSFPEKLSDRGVRERKSYTIHPRFSVPCMDGTLFIFTTFDDLHFCHEAKFLDLGDALGYRFAFVFRWVQLKGVFYANPEHGFARKPIPSSS